MKKNLLILALLITGLMKSAVAGVIAIIDSGVDYKHVELAQKMWTNPGEIPGNNRDDDKNLYRDDVYGWNFAGSNNQVINYKYLNRFSQDPYKYLEIQGKYIKGEATSEEIAWMRSKVKEKEFKAEMQIFGNFSHGTHVAGIASRLSQDSKIMAVKLLPTEVGETLKWLRSVAGDSLKLQSLFGDEDSFLKSSKGLKNSADRRKQLLTKVLKALASQQVGVLQDSIRYVGDHGAAVVNGSFGTSYKMIKTVTDSAFRIIYLKKPTEADSLMAARLYFDENIKLLSNVMTSYPKTLFVFAAGNDGTNNDVYPASPANVKLSNVISVAATIENSGLASFSNYGAKNVDLGAPGVAIVSPTPTSSHKDTVTMSGTSQAAPYVAGVASNVKEINGKLTPAEVKKLILETVDKKDFLFRKVASEGVINAERAFFAANQTLELSLDKAIALSKISVQDQPSSSLNGNNDKLLDQFFRVTSFGSSEELKEAMEKEVPKIVKDILKKK